MTQQVENAAVHAARRGFGLHKYKEDHTADGTLEILTGSDILEAVPEGYQIMVTGFTYNLETVSDDCEFEVVSVDDDAGDGDATRLGAYSHIFTASSNTPASSQERCINPPYCVKYSDGARSVTMRIDANDSSCVVTCGWTGWIEKET